MGDTTLPADHADRLARARLSLNGLSAGDAFGQRFFHPPNFAGLIADRAVPRPPWAYTDDTEMALAIFEVLGRHERVDPDALALRFARRYDDRPWGGTAGWPRTF